MSTRTTAASERPGVKTRDLFFPVSMILLISVIAIVSLIVVAAHDQDKTARATSTHLAGEAVKRFETDLGTVAREMIWWDEASANRLLAPDPSWVDRYLVGHVLPEYAISSLFVVDAEDRTTLAVTGAGRATESAFGLLPTGLRPLIEQARSAPIDEPVPAIGLIRDREGALQVVAASAMVPEAPDARASLPHPRPVLVVTQRLDAGVLAGVSEHYLLDDLHVGDPGGEAGHAFVPLLDPGGEEIGSLAWRADRPGRALLIRALPATAGVFLLIALFFWLFLRRAQRARAQLDQGTALERLNARLEEEMSTRRRIEADLRDALEREKELSRLKSRFVAMASHEFRTPLTTIAASSDLLLRYGERMSDDDKVKNLEEIQSEVRNMTELLEDILLIGQGEADRIRFDPAPLDLDRFCVELVEKTEALSGYSHPIRYTPDRDLADAVVDAKLLRHILINLLSNAIKYSPAGAPISFRVTRRDGAIVFRVRDRGLGIPKGDVELVFEAFHRAENAADYPGTGLGLTIAKKAIDLHGGTIVVDSIEGAGTDFTVTIPDRGRASAKDETGRGRGGGLFL